MTNTDSALITWHPTIDLPGHMRLQTADLHGQLTAAECRSTVLHGSLYAIGGTDLTRGLVAGYVGMSAALAPGRAWRSYVNWTRNVNAFTARRIALIKSEDDLGDDELHVMEARIIRALSARGLYMLNTQCSAREASRRLGDRAYQAAVVGDQLAAAIDTAVFAGRTNQLTSPAHTLREASVRTVLSAARALSTEEVLQRLPANGAQPSGSTPLRTVRRDLTIRELDTAGQPRIHSAYRRGRTVYWPATMPAATAFARYDAAQRQGSSPTC